MPVTINGTSGLVTATTFSGSSLSGIDTGKILQVKQTVKTNTFSTNHQSQVDVTGLNVSITPTSTSNKILVTYDLNLSLANGSYQGSVFLLRDSTQIYLGDAEGNRRRVSNFVMTTNDGTGHMQYYPVHGEFLDSPATTNAITYKIQVFGHNSSGNTLMVNRTTYNADNAENLRTVSQITAKEVAA